MRYPEVFRHVSPRHVALRRRLRRVPPSGVTTFYFIIVSQHTVRLTADAARILMNAGRKVRFVLRTHSRHEKPAREELKRNGFVWIDLRELPKAIGCSDIVVTSSDSDVSPQPVRWFLDTVHGFVTTVGLVEGARRHAVPHRFRRVEFLLAMGPSSRRHFPRTVYVVGSPVIEAGAKDYGPRREPGRFLLVNVKVRGDDPEGHAWIEGVVRACEASTFDYRLSCHPKAAPLIDSPHITQEHFSTLLPDALALITDRSTTVYEALVLGIPVVLFADSGFDKAPGEFAEPHGAFPIVRSADALMGAIDQAVASRPDFGQIAQAFLDENLSIDPDRSASERIAAALLEIEHSRAIPNS